MHTNTIRSEVRQFVQRNFIYSAERHVGDEESLLGSGIVDSTGVLELISFLESRYDLKFSDHELTAENFDSVGRIALLVSSKSVHAAA